ncbi:MAG TPA: cell wall-binding repeat-containing protein [candidate division Zixibacteria bacterium]|nr:cell wall-binding repeat-containing protein [candidate division Zixibacteria bacterium]
MRLAPKRHMSGSRVASMRLIALLLALLMVRPVTLPSVATADPGDAAAAAAWLASTRGGTAADWQLVYERQLTMPQARWAGKLVGPNGELATVYRAPDGTLGGPELLSSVPATGGTSGSSTLSLKADDALTTAVARSKPDRALPVAVWLEADATAAVAEVIARHPEVEWLGDRPVAGDLETARALRAELWEARRAVYAEAQASIRAEVEALGGRVAYAASAAPVVFVDLPAGRVADLAARPRVRSLGLEQAWSPQMSSAGPTVEANWTSGSGDSGSGVRVAVVEYHNVRGTGDLSGTLAASHSTSGKLAYTSSGQFDHPTWVAGAIASQSSTYRGVAPAARIVSSGTGGYTPSLTYDRAVVAAADWAIAPSGGDADIVNTSLVQDTATGAEEARRYFDSIVYEGARLAVSAAGNYVNRNSWAVGSPGTGWNVLTVGGIDDRGTVARGDDRIWNSSGNGSCYLDPPGTAWNAHGDFNKPNLVGPAVGVRTANGLQASGTSVATPIVAGIAAQIIARRPQLATLPEATRAILTAGAIHHTPLSNGAVSPDHEGAGLINAKWANRILNVGDGTWGGHTVGVIGPGDTPQVSISVRAGDRVRVALAWSSHTSGASDLGKADSLRSDLDLRVVQPDGRVAGSWSFDNSYEWVEFTAARGGTATITVPHDRFDTDAERYALAWAKIPPTASVARLAGSDRFATAAAASRSSFAPGVPVAYVATGSTFPDALAAGPMAARAGGPILLVTRSVLPRATADELTRLRPGRIVVLGGETAVDAGTLNELQQFTSGGVTRLAGADRYATAVEVSRAAFGDGAPVAFLATGAAFPDALVAGPPAALRGGPILLTKPTELPAVVRAELLRLQPTQVHVLGGTGAVSDAVLHAVRAALPAASVARLAGADRYGTAAQVVNAFFGPVDRAYLATGADFPDALSAVPVAARAFAPLLLTAPGWLPAPIRDQLVRTWPRSVSVLGGSAAVSDGVVQQVRSWLSP